MPLCVIIHNTPYDQWDPRGEGEQLQVPQCKHLRGPDMDYTHPNTGQESQAKTVPSASAEEIQGLTSNPENFLFRGHRKCIDSVWYRNVSNQDCKALQRVVHIAERISGSTLPSLLSVSKLFWAFLGHLPQTLQKQSC